jgi:hypothetical protein
MLHHSIRIITRGLDILIFGLMMLLLPLAPLTCAILSGRAQYLWQFRSTLVKSARGAVALLDSHVVSRNLQRKLRTSKQHNERMEGSCTHCGQCCINHHCVFLNWDDHGASRCGIYGNWFWSLTSCGSYPLDSESIAVYSCPSFKAIPIRVMTSDN